MAGVAFSIGLGMKHHNLFEDVLVGPWGTATAIALTAFQRRPTFAAVTGSGLRSDAASRKTTPAR